MKNLLLRVCFGSASQPLPLLAMTKGVRHCQPFFTCHCEPKAWQSQKNEIRNTKQYEKTISNQQLADS